MGTSVRAICMRSTVALTSLRLRSRFSIIISYYRHVQCPWWTICELIEATAVYWSRYFVRFVRCPYEFEGQRWVFSSFRLCKRTIVSLIRIRIYTSRNALCTFNLRICPSFADSRARSTHRRTGQFRLWRAIRNRCTVVICINNGDV